jgi:hypothetical protein
VRDIAVGAADRAPYIRVQRKSAQARAIEDGLGLYYVELDGMLGLAFRLHRKIIGERSAVSNETIKSDVSCRSADT